MDKKINIALYGDSISKGVIFDETRQRYSLIKNSFANIVKDKLSIEVLNDSKFGATIINGAKKIFSDIISGKPDAIIVEYGGNDCDFNWKEVAKDPKSKHEPKTNFASFNSTLNNIVKTLKNDKIKPILLTLPPLDADKYYEWIKKFASDNDNNILKWLGSVNKIYWWQEKYNLAIMKTAYSTNSQVIDIRSDFLDTDDYRDYLCSDGIHPNERGHELIANTILSFVKNNYNQILK